MIVEVKVPVFSESVSEGTLGTWRKNPGEFVRRDEVLVELETDKVVLEIVAPSDGVLTELKFPSGSVVKSDQIVAVVDTEAKANVQATKSTAASGATAATKSARAEAVATAAPRMGPAARKLVAETGIDPTMVPPSGRGERVTKADVAAFLEQKPTPTSEPQSIVRAMPPAANLGDRAEKRVTMTRLRARIAERLKDAQNTAAILTTFNEVNMKPVMDLRQRYKDQFEKEHGVRLGFMSFFVKAAVEALKKFPVVNASIDETDIVYHGYFDIGVAVSSPRGLIVPVIRNADALSFSVIEKTINEFGVKAKDNKLSMEELTGGTFTISNGGVFGSLVSTPILNPPQSAILGMHKIQERPVAENGQVVIRPMMYLALSYDHRLIDGQEAVLFLVKIKEQLEDPARLLLQI